MQLTRQKACFLLSLISQRIKNCNVMQPMYRGHIPPYALFEIVLADKDLTSDEFIDAVLADDNERSAEAQFKTIIGLGMSFPKLLGFFDSFSECDAAFNIRMLYEDVDIYKFDKAECFWFFVFFLAYGIIYEHTAINYPFDVFEDNVNIVKHARELRKLP